MNTLISTGYPSLDNLLGGIYPGDFVCHYDRIVSPKAKEILRNSSPKDWSQVGWRGLMYGNGEI